MEQRAKPMTNPILKDLTVMENDFEKEMRKHKIVIQIQSYVRVP
jgi:hypothetical protein